MGKVMTPGKTAMKGEQRAASRSRLARLVTLLVDLRRSGQLVVAGARS